MNTNDADDGKGIDYKDEETLRRLYHDEGLSSIEIAERAGVSKTTILRRMRKHGIDRLGSVEARRKGPANYRVDSEGYVRADSFGDHVRIHQLIAIAKGHDPHKVFSSDYHSHHIKPIPWLNTPENITVMSEGEHMEHHAQGAKRNSTLTESKAKEIYQRCHESDELQKEIAEEFDVSPQLVTDIKKGRRWGWATPNDKHTS